MPCVPCHGLGRCHRWLHDPSRILAPPPLQPHTTSERCGPHRYDAKTAGGSSVADEAAIGRTAKGAQGDTLVASHVGDMDMVRIREAEKIIDTDEVAFGKYIMDEVREKGARPLYALRARVVHAL
jgi:hypothetical protein